MSVLTWQRKTAMHGTTPAYADKDPGGFVPRMKSNTSPSPYRTWGYNFKNSLTGTNEPFDIPWRKISRPGGTGTELPRFTNLVAFSWSFANDGIMHADENAQLRVQLSRPIRIYKIDYDLGIYATVPSSNKATLYMDVRVHRGPIDIGLDQTQYASTAIGQINDFGWARYKGTWNMPVLIPEIEIYAFTFWVNAWPSDFWYCNVATLQIYEYYGNY